MSKLEDIVSLCKRRGFIFNGSEVYGGMAGTWDFGPLGVTLKKKIPVFLVYFTAWVDQSGELHFRRDIYKHDQKMAEKLFQK